MCMSVCVPLCVCAWYLHMYACSNVWIQRPEEEDTSQLPDSRPYSLETMSPVEPGASLGASDSE